MPGRDRTGPAGDGPATGRGLGPCGRGLGYRRGFERGFGWRARYSEDTRPLTKEEEKKILEAEKAEIEKELKELETKKNEN